MRAKEDLWGCHIQGVHGRLIDEDVAGEVREVQPRVVVYPTGEVHSVVGRYQLVTRT